MNRDVCEHFVPVDLPCDKCKSASVQKSTLREAAQAVLNRWDSPAWEWLKQGPTAALMADLRAALAEPVQERKPLTEEQIHNLYLHMSGKAEGLGEADFPVMFARAVEDMHDIGEKE